MGVNFPTIVRELRVPVFTNSLYILYDFRKFIGSRNSDMILTNSINWKRLPFFWVMSGFLRVSFCCLDFQKRENMGVPRGKRGNKINKLENEIDNKRRNANQAIGCGVVLGGHTAINCLMDL